MRLEASKLNESVCYSLFQYLGRNKVKLNTKTKASQYVLHLFNRKCTGTHLHLVYYDLVAAHFLAQNSIIFVSLPAQHAI